MSLTTLVLLWPGTRLPCAATAAASDASSDQLLDIDVVLLDPGLPSDPALNRPLGVFPEVRRVEAYYFAVGLRRRLADAGRWGMVRVVPARDEAAELTLSGTILRSDGEVLELALVATDSTGRRWIDHLYRVALPAPPAAQSAAADVSGSDAGTDGREQRDALLRLYGRVADDLAGVLESLDDPALTRIRDVSRLRYAADLAPGVFGGYLREREDGVLELRRLPARDDPMLRRVRRVRATDYQFKDTVDELYGRAYEEVRDAYELWQRYRAQQADYVEGRAERLSRQDRRERGGSSSYAALKNSYENYKWSKLQEQVMLRLASRLDSEVSPTVTTIEGQVVELSGSIEAQYAQWRALLRSIFELETGEAEPVP